MSIMPDNISDTFNLTRGEFTMLCQRVGIEKVYKCATENNLSPLVRDVFLVQSISRRLSAVGRNCNLVELEEAMESGKCPEVRDLAYAVLG